MKGKWLEKFFDKQVPTIYFARVNTDKYLITNDGDIINVFENYRKSGLIAAKIVVPKGTGKVDALAMYNAEVGLLTDSPAFDNNTDRRP